MLQSTEFDDLDFMLLSLILANCQKEDCTKIIKNGNKRHIVELHKGQSYINVSSLARLTAVGRQNIANRIKRISKTYSSMDSKPCNFGLIVTVFEYDSLISFNSKMAAKPSEDVQQRNSNATTHMYKIDKSDKRGEREIFKISPERANHDLREKHNWPRPDIDPNTWETWEDVPMELTAIEAYDYKYDTLRQQWEIYLSSEERDGTLRRKIHRYYFPERYPA